MHQQYTLLLSLPSSKRTQIYVHTHTYQIDKLCRLIIERNSHLISKAVSQTTEIIEE